MRLPSLRNIPSLEPSSLSLVTAQAVEELMREGESLNTLASYRSALRYWAAWFGLRYGQGITLPLPANAVLQFIVDHAQRTTTDGLAHELPPAIDQALVDAGFKGKPGPMALNTLIHRIHLHPRLFQKQPDCSGSSGERETSGGHCGRSAAGMVNSFGHRGRCNIQASQERRTPWRTPLPCRRARYCSRARKTCRATGGVFCALAEVRFCD